MAVDLIQLTATLKDALLRDLGDEVELIFRYGSFLKNATHHYSDLDISYVPVHEATWHSITVMVDDMLCDLYPIHWSRLESMANFENISSTVLLNYQIVYQRSEEAAARLRSLAEHLHTLQQPAARAEMLKKAQTIFQNTGYPYYLLRQAVAQGHLLACWQQSQQLLTTVLHCLAVCNQKCIDTRKLGQVLALPKLPANFAETVDQLTHAHEPTATLAACEQLLNTTRDLLLAEQRQAPDAPMTFAAAFGTGYPELKNALQHVLLACERQDMFALQGSLLSLYQEISFALARVGSGIAYSSFNSLAEYEQDLVALGFPALLPYVVTEDFTGLHQQCLLFDQHLWQFLKEHSVTLNTFAKMDELQNFLRTPRA